MVRHGSLADRLPALQWPRILDRWTRQITLLMRGFLQGNHNYGVVVQIEYATDVIFENRPLWAGPCHRLLRLGVRRCGAKDVMVLPEGGSEANSR